MNITLIFNEIDSPVRSIANRISNFNCEYMITLKQIIIHIYFDGEILVHSIVNQIFRHSAHPVFITVNRVFQRADCTEHIRNLNLEYLIVSAIFTAS